MLAPATPSRLLAHGRAFSRIAQFHPELTALRRDLHAHPELGFEEVYTAARVQEVAQKHQVLRPGGGQHGIQPRQIVGRGAVRHGLARAAKRRRLAKVHIGHERHARGGPPDGALGQQPEQGAAGQGERAGASGGCLRERGGDEVIGCVHQRHCGARWRWRR